MSRRPPNRDCPARRATAARPPRSPPARPPRRRPAHSPRSTPPAPARGWPRRPTPAGRCPRTGRRRRPDAVRPLASSAVSWIEQAPGGRGHDAASSDGVHTASSARPHTSARITMPGPPPYGASSTERCRSVAQSRRSCTPSCTTSSAIALPSSEFPQRVEVRRERSSGRRCASRRTCRPGARRRAGGVRGRPRARSRRRTGRARCDRRAGAPAGPGRPAGAGRSDHGAEVPPVRVHRRRARSAGGRRTPRGRRCPAAPPRRRSARRRAALSAAPRSAMPSNVTIQTGPDGRASATVSAPGARRRSRCSTDSTDPGANRASGSSVLG